MTTFTLPVGQHAIEVLFFENGGYAGIDLDYRIAGQGRQQLVVGPPPSPTNLTDISGLAGLDNLRVLSLTRNAIEDVSPLAGLKDLELLDLRNNAISDVAALFGQRVIDDGEPGYREDGAGFLGNVSPVATAFEQDYRFRQVEGDSDLFESSWTFEDLEPGTYEVLVTWPEDDSHSTSVFYSFEAGSPIEAIDNPFADGLTGPQAPNPMAGGRMVTIDTDT